MEIMTNDFKKASFQGQVIESSQQEKIKASLKKMLMFWGFALISLFIPVFHFVLVPLFLLLGIGFFFYQMKQSHSIDNLSFNCPACGKENKIKKMHFKDEARFRCQSCSVQLILR